MNLSGKTAIITGASRGIGRELAGLLSQRGVRLVLTGRNAERLEAVAADLRRSGSAITTVSGDVSDPVHCAQVVAAARRDYGGVDVLFNNAGLSMRGAIADLSDEVVKTLLDVNLRGSITMTVAALPEVLRSRGSIIFVSTLAALHGFSGVSIYSASKMGLTAFSQSLRAEHARDGLHTGIVFLGFTENDPDKTILDASGNPFHHQRTSGLSRNQAANRLIRTWVRRRRRDRTVPVGVLLDLAVRFFPRLTAAVLQKSGGAIHRVENRPS